MSDSFPRQKARTRITHMTPQEAVAKNLLTVQVDFLRGALGLPPAG